MVCFFYNDAPATGTSTYLHTRSQRDARPICWQGLRAWATRWRMRALSRSAPSRRGPRRATATRISAFPTISAIRSPPNRWRVRCGDDHALVGERSGIDLFDPAREENWRARRPSRRGRGPVADPLEQRDAQIARKGGGEG